MMKVKVIARLNKRPLPATNNTPLPDPLSPHDILEIVEIVPGEEVRPGNNRWLKTDKGFFVWSGGVVSLLNYNELTPDIPNGMRSTRGKGVRVAVLDSGVFAEHHSLTRAVNGTDNSSKALSGMSDLTGHGTHCSGIIGARNVSTSLDLITGIAPACELLVAKVITERGNYLPSNVRLGMRWAIDKQAHVINMSFGLDHQDDKLEKLLVEAREKGIFLIAAAGENKGLADRSTLHYPASHDCCIAIGAVDEDSLRSGLQFSDKLSYVTAFADVLSCDTQQDKCIPMKGSSMATAIFSGICSLVLADQPRLSRIQLIKAIDAFTPTLDQFSSSTPLRIFKT